MEDEDRILLRQIAAQQQEMLGILRHGLAGPPGDHGPRKGWLRELIAEMQRVAHPAYVFNAAPPPGKVFYYPDENGVVQPIKHGGET